MKKTKNRLRAIGVLTLIPLMYLLSLVMCLLEAWEAASDEWHDQNRDCARTIKIVLRVLRTGEPEYEE